MAGRKFQVDRSIYGFLPGRFALSKNAGISLKQ